MNETKIVVNLNGNELEVMVKDHAAFTERTIVADSAAGMVVDKKGRYRPWLKEFCLKLGIIRLYTDLNIPEDMDDDQIAEFLFNEYDKIEEHIERKEIENLKAWVNEKTEMLKDLYYKNPAKIIEEVLGEIGKA